MSLSKGVAYALMVWLDENYTQSDGLVERLNKTFRELLHQKRNVLVYGINAFFSDMMSSLTFLYYPRTGQLIHS